VNDAERAGPSDVTRLTKVIVLVVIPILLVAGLILFGFPAHTESLWAWTINSQMTAMAIGGGYLSGAVFLVLAARARAWADVVVGLVAASVLTALLLGATALHWDKFHHGHVAFWIWTAVYVVTPVLLPIVIVTNQRRAVFQHRSEALRVPAVFRVGVTLAGLGAMSVAAVMYVQPNAVISLWPWPLTPLTARVIAAFVAFIATVCLAFAVTDRWAVLRRPVAGAAIGLSAVGIGALRAHEEFSSLPDPATLAFVVLLTGAVGGLLALLLWMRVVGSRHGPPSGVTSEAAPVGGGGTRRRAPHVRGGLEPPPR
jgi:heme exporter protein D